MQDPMTSTKMSLDDAIAAAEKHVRDKAVRAEYERRKDGSWTYDVEVNARSKVFDVKIMPDKGLLLRLLTVRSTQAATTGPIDRAHGTVRPRLTCRRTKRRDPGCGFC
jgi:Peptidase propeptide and YPEB domain